MLHTLESCTQKQALCNVDFITAYMALRLSNATRCCAADTDSIASQDWLAFELTPQMVEKLSSSTDDKAINKVSITMPELTLRLELYTVHHMQSWRKASHRSNAALLFACWQHVAAAGMLNALLYDNMCC